MKLLLLSIFLCSCYLPTEETSEQEAIVVSNGGDLSSPDMRPIGPKPTPLKDDKVSIIQKGLQSGMSPISKKDYPQ